jgi:hypothetical protein
LEEVSLHIHATTKVEVEVLIDEDNIQKFLVLNCLSLIGNPRALMMTNKKLALDQLQISQKEQTARTKNPT